MRARCRPLRQRLPARDDARPFPRLGCAGNAREAATQLDRSIGLLQRAWARLSDSAALLGWFLRDSPALSEVPRDVLTWFVLGLTYWLAIGVLTAKLFGAIIGDADDRELTTGSRA